MMRIKQCLLVMISLLIVLTSYYSYGNHALKEAAAQKTEGKLTSKDEVVYAALNANGEQNEIYVVNTLDVAKPGEILDFGNYRSIKNLTDLSELVQEDGTVKIQAPEGKFYYQGNMKDDAQLPWNFAISYKLNGEEAAPSELAGKSGHLTINIDTAANETVDPVFYDNYVLQVSLLLPNRYDNIEASGGMIANAGKNKQITFTVLPGQNKSLEVQADVENFELQGIEIAAVPSSLPFDTAQMEDMTEDMSTLSDAIGELHRGVADLKEGVSQLNNGGTQLQEGSQQFQKGMNQIGNSSSDIVGASSSIREALVKISQSLTGNPSAKDLTSLNELPDGLRKLANGLTESANGLSSLQKNYSQAYSSLASAIEGIPAGKLTDGEVAALRGSGADAQLVEKVLAYYSAAQKVRGTYTNTKQAFDAVEPSLKQSSGAMQNISDQLVSIANDLSKSPDMNSGDLRELQKGLNAIAANYQEFHSGLVHYADGVTQLSDNYNDLNAGISNLTNGTSELEKGVNELHSGTAELNQETKNLPDQMQEEINGMIEEYDKSDFIPVSFVSPKNEKVYNVQFVIKTESIELEEQKEEKDEPVKEKGFWDRLQELF